MRYRIKVIDKAHLQTTADLAIDFVEDHSTRLIISLENGDKFEAIAGNAFTALRKVRQQTEPKGIKLLIQGCRPNCWPSGMSASMSNGIKIYERQLPLGSDSFLVETFDEAAEHEVGTLQQQDDFNKEWITIRTAGG